MSSSKPRVRRNREKKQFIEREQQDNQIGVLDESDIKNKLQQKQEDMFGAHKLQQNILQEQPGTAEQPQAIIDFEDEPQEGNAKINPFEEVKKEEKPRKQRKRGAKESDKKRFVDEEEPLQQKQEEKQQKKESIFQQEGETQPQQQQQLIDIPSPKSQSSSSNEREEEQQRRAQESKMRELAKKKVSVSMQNYIHMHILLGKAGVNKEERRAAIYTPLPVGSHSFVYFKRYQSGFSEYYQVQGEDQRPILFCENQRGCIGCNYYVSLTKEMDKNNPAYLGKLRGNAAGSIYQLYDSGLQPNNDYDRSKFRVNMAYVEYESNFLGMKGPRKFKAIVPKVQELQDYDMFKFSEEEGLNSFVGNNVINLKNKQPRWNERLKSYALNFGGRVKQASIKNFILIQDCESAEEEEKAQNVIIFGKIDENTFALEFWHPLSLFQAFGIAMSEFDFKLKCE